MEKDYKNRMVKYTIIIVGLLSISINLLNAQYTIQGRIVDAETGKGIKNASIIIYYTALGCSSDSLGYFTLKSNNKFPNLIASHVGYRNTFFQVAKANKDSIVISMVKNYYIVGEFNLNPDSLVSLLDSFSCDSSTLTDKDERFDQIFVIVEDLCSYPGGVSCFNHYFLSNLSPYIFTGTIKPFGNLEIYFTIDKLGKPVDVMLNKEIPDDFLKLINLTFLKMQKWNPATQRGEEVPVTLILKLRYEETQ